MVRNIRLVCLVDEEEYKIALKNTDSYGSFSISDFMRARLLETNLIEQSIAEINNNVKENNKNVKKVIELIEKIK
jgi:hypothetical protein